MRIFIVWDKLFGTFQAELAHIPPVYGITRPVQTWNPIKINFQHFWLLLQDAWRAENWFDKLRIWLMPTGWRPADVEKKYPVYKIDEPYQYQKYALKSSQTSIIWALIQYTVMFGFLMHFYMNIAQIGMPNIFLLGAFLFLNVYAYTELMDNNPNAIYAEILKMIIGFALIYYIGDWFGAGKFGTWAVKIYLVISACVVWFISRRYRGTNI